MPIQISQEDTRLSFAYAVNAAQDSFTINRDGEQKRTDNIFKDASKVIVRIPTNAFLGTFAGIETALKAFITGLSAILYFATDRPFNYMKASLSLAGRTTVEAFKGIAGFATPAPVVEEKKKEEAPAPVVVEETPTEQPAPVVETPVAPAPKGWVDSAKENKRKIAAFVLGAIVLGVTAYYFRSNIANAFSKETIVPPNPIVDNRHPVAPGLLFPPTYPTCAPDKARDAITNQIRAAYTKSPIAETRTLEKVQDAILQNQINSKLQQEIDLKSIGYLAPKKI